MRNERIRFAGILAIGATILLISILVGTRLGDHVIVSADGKGNDVAVDLPTPVPVSSASVPPASGKWKKSHVVAVATDPAFPDPRLTPTPEPTPTPTPKPTSDGNGQPAGKPGDGPGQPPAVKSNDDLNVAPSNGPTPRPRPLLPGHTHPPTTDELGE